MLAVYAIERIYELASKNWKERLQYSLRSGQLASSAELNFTEGWRLDTARLQAKEYADLQAEWLSRWVKYTMDHGTGSNMVVTDAFSELVKTGVPDVYRRWVWSFCSGGMRKLEANPGRYKELRALADVKQSRAVLDEIDRDVPRSMPAHPFFKKPESLEGLRSVLYAYSVRAPAIAYCQGMNIIAAQLMLYMPEEEAFWTLAAIVEDISPDYYTKQLLGSVVDQSVFADLVKRYAPHVSRHFDTIGLPLEVVSVAWFMVYFIDYIPYEASLRVIDNVLMEGTTTLFQVGLALLSLLEKTIISEKQAHEIGNKIKNAKYSANELLTLAFQTKYAQINTTVRIDLLRIAKKHTKLQDIEQESVKNLLSGLKSHLPKCASERHSHFRFAFWRSLICLILSFGRGACVSFRRF